MKKRGKKKKERRKEKSSLTGHVEEGAKTRDKIKVKVTKWRLELEEDMCISSKRVHKQSIWWIDLKYFFVSFSFSFSHCTCVSLWLVWRTFSLHILTMYPGATVHCSFPSVFSEVIWSKSEWEGFSRLKKGKKKKKKNKEKKWTVARKRERERENEKVVQVKRKLNDNRVTGKNRMYNSTLGWGWVSEWSEIGSEKHLYKWYLGCIIDTKEPTQVWELRTKCLCMCFSWHNRTLVFILYQL